MADEKKTLEITFEEKGASQPRDPNTPPPPPIGPPGTPGTPGTPGQQAQSQSSAASAALAALLDDQERWRRWQSGGFEPGSEEEAQFRRMEAGRSDLGPPSGGGGPPRDPFGVFDTGSIDPAQLQQTISQLEEELAGLSEAGAAAARAGFASANASEQAAGAASAAAQALGGGGAGGGGAAAGGAAGAAGAGGGGLAGIGLAGAATAAAVALGLTVAAGLAFNHAVNAMVEDVGMFSAEVVKASTESRLREIQDRLRLARETGPDVAGLERQRSEIASELRGIYREFLEIIIPILSAIAPVLELILEVLRGILAAINLIIDIMEYTVELFSGWAVQYLSWVPGLGPILKRFDKWMRSNNMPVVPVDLTAVDELFDPDNVGVRPVDLGDPNIP